MARGPRPVPRRDQHPGGDRLSLHLCQPTPRTRLGSALAAGAGAAQRGDLADLSRHRAQPRPGVVAVRYRKLSRGAAERLARHPLGVAPPVGLPARRPVSRGAGRLRCRVLARAGCRRRNAAADIFAAGQCQISGSILIYDRRSAAAGANRSRGWPRNSPICAASSAKAMCATPSPASASPMLSRSSALTASARPRRLACREPIPSPSVS